MTTELEKRDYRNKLEKSFKEEEKRYSEIPLEDEPQGCRKRIGLRFIPYEEEGRFQLLATFACEDYDLPLLHNPDSKCWGCGQCGLEVQYDPAQAYLKLAKESIEDLDSRLKKRGMWWRLRNWWKRKRNPSSLLDS